MSEKTNKTDYISFASVVSALAVIVLHANDCFWTFSATEFYWKTANFIECLFYFAVPVFFMISGATLLDFFDRYGLQSFFAKRCQKTLVPYLFWSLFGLVFQVFCLGMIPLGDVNANSIVNGLLNGRLVVIYWFFIPLFCAYLAIPLLAAVREDLRKTVFIYLAVAGFIINSLIPFLNAVMGLGLDYWITVAPVREYLLFFVVGYLLNRYELSFRGRCVLYAAGVYGFLLHFFGTMELSIQAGEIVKTYKEYCNVPGVLSAVAMFVLFKYGGGKLMENPKVKKVIDALKGYTFSVYLLHWYLLKLLIRVFGIDITSLVWRLGAPVLVFALVVGLTKVARKIPLVKKYLLP